MAARRNDKDLTPQQWEIRNLAESDLESFIRLVSPKQVLGAIHIELCQWWTRQDAKTHQVVLLPRDHGKSRYIAFRVAWYITNYPDCRILYISATSGLAEKQIKFIKDILTSPIYTKYWPEMIHPEEGKREKWTSTEFSVDHPKRKEEAVRDPTVFIAGLTTSITGMHCDVAVHDDVVVYENAYTPEGRAKVKSQYSLLSSIEGGDALQWVVGTRYHPEDLYSEMISMQMEIFDDKGNIVDYEPVYEIFERVVEDAGDGTGQFLWPRQQRSDGRWFGFDIRILAKKRAQYMDKTQFRAQYYNDPNSGEDAGINRGKFQYWDKQHLRFDGMNWYYKNSRLNIIVSMDFSVSTGKRSDYTAITVVGVDGERNYYVLDIDRFKTDSIREYYEHFLAMYTRWDFKKAVFETVAAQQVLVKELREAYLKPNGIMLSIIEVKPNRHQGSKEERIAAILEPLYENMVMYHYRGGNAQVLEDELVLQFPPHDDCKDALSNALEHLTPPTSSRVRNGDRNQNVVYHPRFGGVVA